MNALPKISLNAIEEQVGLQAGKVQPVTNVNTLVNSLFGRPTVVLPTPTILPPPDFPDVSFYQGEINFAKMATKTGAVIIRAGQNKWIDVRFSINWLHARLAGLKRGVYWFYDDRVDPGTQARLLVSLIKNDLPEMEIWIDWENTYGGQFKGLKNVVAMVQLIEQLLPRSRVGLYTGYYWFIANSNAILDYTRYQYLKERPLWLAQYNVLSSMLKIPKPYTYVRHHQYGTPTVGPTYGVKSLELDMNRFVDPTMSWEQLYNGSIVLPEPTIPGGPVAEPVLIDAKWMKVTATTLNIRKVPGSSAVTDDIGDMKLGTVVRVDKTIIVNMVTWYHLTTALYNNMPVVTIDGKPVSERDDCWASGVWLVDTPEPNPQPTVPNELHIDIDFIDNKITGSVRGYAQGKPFDIVF